MGYSPPPPPRIVKYRSKSPTAYMNPELYSLDEALDYIREEYAHGRIDFNEMEEMTETLLRRHDAQARRDDGLEPILGEDIDIDDARAVRAYLVEYKKNIGPPHLVREYKREDGILVGTSANPMPMPPNTLDTGKATRY